MPLAAVACLVPNAAVQMQLQSEAGVAYPTRTLQVPPERRSGWCLVSIRELQWQLEVNLFLNSLKIFSPLSHYKSSGDLPRTYES